MQRQVYRAIARRSHSTAAITTTTTITDKARQCYLNHLTGADSGIVELILNRPEAKNSLGKQLMAELNQCLDHLNQPDTKSDGTKNSTRVLIIKSTTPGIFCSGADLKERLSLSAPSTITLVTHLRSTFTRISTLPIPTIAAINGVALGGGLELALSCDLRVASWDCAVGLVEGRLGIIPGAGGTQRLARVVGVARAKEMVFCARVLGGGEAVAIGLVNGVASGGGDGKSDNTGDKKKEAMEAVHGKALALAREILPQGPIAMRMAKRAISEGSQVSLAEGLEIEGECYAGVVYTKDRLEGLNAFREKRKPVFIGE